MTGRWGWIHGITLAVALLAVAPAVHAATDDYVIGPEDVLQVSVWMHSDLDKSVTVSAEGNITFAPIGDFKAAGLTPAQLADRLSDRLSTYLRSTTTVTVNVTQFMSRSIYVQGAVAKPGRLGFERLPNIVDVLSQAGGATPGADLSAVQVTRLEGDHRRTFTVDVASALREGVTTNLPPLKPGDTIVVPAGLGGTMAPSDAAGVLGEVNKPGLYPVGPGHDVWTVLAAAGGLTQRGDLAVIKVLTRQASGQTVFDVNLKEQLHHGTRAPFLVHGGDVVYVAATGSSTFGRAWTGFTQVLDISKDLLNIAIIADYLKHRNP